MIYRTDLCQMTSVVFQIIMNSNKHLHKSYVHKLLEPWLGTGLITANGESLTDKNIDECDFLRLLSVKITGFWDVMTCSQ
jgi:hypothetical protein